MVDYELVNHSGNSPDNRDKASQGRYAEADDLRRKPL
jgi:hypothetical protein